MDGDLTHPALGILYGTIVGLSLGLTGGGGSIFAVPLLIYGLAVPFTAAAGLSLAAVGATAGFGAVLRLRSGEIDFRAGLVFAAGGMLCAPLGAALGRIVPQTALLVTFALMMFFVGLRMWKGRADGEVTPAPCESRPGFQPGPGCRLKLLSAGAAAGVLSGLFGVGGGFVIVPALVFVTGMNIHRAVATSLLVIFLISVSGVAVSLMHETHYPMPVSALFMAGGILGMFAGARLRDRLNAVTLRKVFAVAMGLIGAYMLVKNLRAGN